MYRDVHEFRGGKCSPGLPMFLLLWYLYLFIFIVFVIAFYFEENILGALMGWRVSQSVNSMSPELTNHVAAVSL